MSSLQCPATLLVAPASDVDPEHLESLLARKVARVWSEPGVVERADLVAKRLGVGVTVAADAGFARVLAEIADEHPGETVLVLTSAGARVEVVTDADGWISTPWR